MSTTATLLTPRGRGAIATIRLDGMLAHRLVAGYLVRDSGRPIARWPRGRMLKAIWRHGHGTQEDVIAYSPSESSLEIHCHGGEAATASILHSLETLGCQIRDWDDWIADQDCATTRREAWLQLPLAATEMTALCLLDQFHGALDRELTVLRADPVPADGADRLRKLEATYVWGQHLTQPWRLALGGPPNAGKSSLLNRILGYHRALVFDIPGTTRDVLRGTTALAGWAIELLDTPGWRGTAGESERMGIERGQFEWMNADMRTLVLDATDSASKQAAQTAQAHLILWNKTDLPDAMTPPATNGVLLCEVSARTGYGLDQFLIMLEKHFLVAPSRDAPVVFSERQHRHVSAALRHWEANDLSAARAAIRQCQEA